MMSYFNTNTQNLTPEGNFETGSALKASDLNLLMQEIRDVYSCFGGLSVVSCASYNGCFPVMNSSTFTISPLWGVSSFGKGGVVWFNRTRQIVTGQSLDVTLEVSKRNQSTPTTVVETTSVTFTQPKQVKSCFLSSQATTATQYIGDFRYVKNDNTVCSFCFLELKQ